MVGVSIAGLVLALVQLGECALVQYNVLDREIPTTLVFELEDPHANNTFAIWFNNLESALQQFQEDYLIYDTNFNPDHRLTFDVSKDGITVDGRFTHDIPTINDIIRSSAVSAENGTTLPPPPSDSSLANLTEFITRQSQLNQLKHGDTLPISMDGYNFKLIYRNTDPSPVYVGATHGNIPKKSVIKLFSKKRVRRQAVLDVPIPVLRPFYSGSDETVIGDCGRNKVEMEDDDDYDNDEEQYGRNTYGEDDDDKCYEVLSRGPCEETEIVLVNPVGRKGICGPRLCSPDRVFLFSDQLCHDPFEAGLCPENRQLFSTGYGTPVCGCENLYYERRYKDDDDDEYEETCEPLLSEIDSCNSGTVFWFTSFREPPSCLPDPCKGLNIGRDYDELPYVPSLKDGKCYQIGSTPKICRSDEYYALDLPKLRGVCQSLDEAGYLTLDHSTLQSYREIYGEPLPKDSPSEPLPVTYRPKTKGYNKTPKMPSIGSPIMPPVYKKTTPMAPLVIGQSVVGPRITLPSTYPTLVPTHVTAHSAPYIAIDGNVTVNIFGSDSVSIQQNQQQTAPTNPWQHFMPKSHSNDPSSQRLVPNEGKDQATPQRRRFKRAPQPFASPGNVFEPALTSCRAGAARDINFKCQNVILPSRTPNSRPRRAIRPVRPFPRCSGGSIRNLQRTCTSSFSSVRASIDTRGLG